MSTEDLMKPRFKVIASYPGSAHEIGKILDPHPKFGYDLFPYPEKYPHIFKPLSWWEDREEKDLPIYVKTKAGNSVRKVHALKGDYVYFSEQKSRNVKHWVPATEKEYHEFTTKQLIAQLNSTPNLNNNNQ